MYDLRQVPAIEVPGWGSQLPAISEMIDSCERLVARGDVSVGLPGTAEQRRNWADADQRYDRELVDAREQLQRVYAKTANLLAAFLPGGIRRLVRKRTDAIARYQAAAEAAAAWFQPVHDDAKRACDRW